MGTVGLGGLASFLGIFWMNGALVGTLFGAFGAKMTGEMIDNYAKEVEDFKFLPLADEWGEEWKKKGRRRNRKMGRKRTWRRRRGGRARERRDHQIPLPIPIPAPEKGPGGAVRPRKDGAGASHQQNT